MARFCCSPWCCVAAAAGSKSTIKRKKRGKVALASCTAAGVMVKNHMCDIGRLAMFWNGGTICTICQAATYTTRSLNGTELFLMYRIRN